MRVVARVRGEPPHHPVHLQHPIRALAVAAKESLVVRGVPERVPAERHEDHRDVEVLHSLPEVRHEVVLTGSGLAACCGLGARVHVREQIVEGGGANMSLQT